jgi:autotransporter-associated beta strand protein
MATKTWDGGGGDGNWTTGANWNGDTAPVAGDDLVFSGSTQVTNVNDFANGTSFNSITFSAGSGSWVITGNSIVLTGGSTALTNNKTTGTASFACNITFGTNAPTLTAVSGGVLALGGTVATGGLAITISSAGTGSIQFNGAVSGTGVITKNGTGIVRFNVANTFSDGFTLNAGTVQVNDNASFGTGTVTINGGTLAQAGSNFGGTFTNAFVFNGSFDKTTNAVTIISGTILLGASITITISTNQLNLDGLISDGGNGYGITKAGGNTLRLNNAGNSFTGPVRVNAGTLQYDSIANVGAACALGAQTTVANATIKAGNAGTAVSFICTGAGTTTDRVIDLSGTTGTVTIGTTVGGSTTLRFTSALTATGAGNKTITLSVTSTGNIRFDQPIANFGSDVITLTKGGSGTGYAILAADCTYTGATSVTSGRLQIGVGGTTGSILNTPSLTLSNGVQFAINRSDTVTQGTHFPAGISGGNTATTFNHSGTGTVSLSGTNTSPGNITITNGGTLNISGTSSFYLIQPSGVAGSTVNIYSATALANDASTGEYRASVNGNINFFIDGGGTITIPTLVSGSNSIAITCTVGNNGSGTNGVVYFTGTRTYSGACTVTFVGNNGYTVKLAQLRIGGAGPTIAANCKVELVDVVNDGVSGNRNFTVSGTSTESIITGSISDGATCITGIIKNGTGKWTIQSTNNNFSSTVSVTNGELAFYTIKSVSGGNSSLGAPTSAANGTISIGSGGSGPSVLTYLGTGDTTDRVINLGSSTTSAFLDHSGTGLLKFTSAVTATGNAGAGVTKVFTLRGSTAGYGEIAGAIPNGAGTSKVGIAKTGTGEWILSGTCTYTGATTVTQGRLCINGTLNSGSAVSVDTAGTLSGSGGTINGSLAMAAGGTINPGCPIAGPIGQINTAGVTCTGGTYAVDLDGTTPTFDKISTTGTLAFGSAVTTLSIASLANSATNDVYTIAQATTSVTGTFVGLLDNAEITAFGRRLRINYPGTTVTLTDIGATGPTAQQAGSMMPLLGMH